MNNRAEGMNWEQPDDLQTILRTFRKRSVLHKKERAAVSRLILDTNWSDGQCMILSETLAKADFQIGLAILQALALVGDGRAIKPVEQIARVPQNPTMQEAATKLLPFFNNGLSRARHSRCFFARAMFQQPASECCCERRASRIRRRASCYG